jgi:hypothetical protein
MKKLLFLAFLSTQIFVPLNLWAASCCGGGSASSLILPKGAWAMLDMSAAQESYDGYWNSQGKHIDDPVGSDLNQYRANLGLAYRLGHRWQMSLQTPYVWNKNTYTGTKSSVNDIGDTSLGLWYETFDDIKCVWKVINWKSLVPAVYLGSTLTIPTGRSAYSGKIDNSFDITGRGVYRLDANLLIDKTIYPWNMSLNMSYGQYLERPVNQDSTGYLQPYDLQLGNRLSTGLSLGYTHFLESLDTLTLTTSYNDVRENEGKIDGEKDSALPGFEKQSLGLSLSYSTAAMDWIYKLSWSHGLEGKDFAATDVINLGFSYVLR